jgi:hypothetical protein
MTRRATREIGRLKLLGVLTDAQYAAGERYARLTRNNRARGRDAAVTALMEAGEEAERAVMVVAVRGGTCPRGALAALKRGLDALAKHFAARKAAPRKRGQACVPPSASGEAGSGRAVGRRPKRRASFSSVKSVSQ